MTHWDADQKLQYCHPEETNKRFRKKLLKISSNTFEEDKTQN